MQWVLWLALVGLVSLAETRSINYEYEDEKGLEHEQKGYAGDVQGKYETMDHNGNVVEVKYVADHMGFRLMEELEITDKNINSPNAELEEEPTEDKTQTEEQNTNDEINRSGKLTEQKMENRAQTNSEGVSNTEDEVTIENTEIEKQSEVEGNNAKALTGEIVGRDTEAEGLEGEKAGAEKREAEVTETEAEEVEAGEAGAGNFEGEEEAGEAVEVTEEETEGDEAEGHELETEEAEGEEAEAEEEGEETEAEDEETEGEEAEGDEESEGVDDEEESEGSEDEEESEGADEEESEGSEDEEVEAEEAEGQETDAKAMASEGTEEETLEQQDELSFVEEQTNNEGLNNENAFSGRKGKDLEYYRLTEILQVPTIEFGSASILPQNRIGSEQVTGGRSSKAKSLVSEQIFDNTILKDDRYKLMREILQVPTNNFQVINVNNKKYDETEIVYYDDQSSDVSNIIISEVNQEMNVLPKRTVSITSKQLNNVSPGTVMIEKTSVSESQLAPEVVLVHMKEPGRLTIEAHQNKEEIPTEAFSKRSSMTNKIKQINEIELSISDEPQMIAQEIFPTGKIAKSRMLDFQPKINDIEAEPMVTITSKQLNNFNPGAVMIKSTSISESQIKPESVVVRMDEPGKLTIESQPVKKEIFDQPIGKRTSLEIEPFQELLEAHNKIELVEVEPVAFVPNYPNPSKVNLGVTPIKIEKSLIDEMPEFTNNQEIEIETDIIENIPVPVALIQPAVSKKMRFVPKPTPVLIQEVPSIQLFEEVPITIEMISQQPTPKEVRIIEVRSAPKPMTIVEVNPYGQTEDVTSGELQSFKVRDFVRF